MSTCTAQAPQAASSAPAPPDCFTPVAAGGGIDQPQSGRPGVVARMLISLICLYQAARAGRPSPCRFVPSCSAYGAEALRRHGAARGVWLAARRLGRCHPWGGHGADPVPELRNP